MENPLRNDPGGFSLFARHHCEELHHPKPKPAPRPYQNGPSATLLENSHNHICLDSPAEAAHEVDDETHQQNQTKPASTKDRPAKIKPSSTEQEKKNKYK